MEIHVPSRYEYKNIWAFILAPTMNMDRPTPVPLPFVDLKVVVGQISPSVGINIVLLSCGWKFLSNTDYSDCYLRYHFIHLQVSIQPKGKAKTCYCKHFLTLTRNGISLMNISKIALVQYAIHVFR